MGILTELYNKRIRAVEQRKRRERKRKYREMRHKKSNNDYVGPYKHEFADPRPRFPTLKGELVRSLSEKYIADYLFTHRLDYQYEKNLKIGGYTVKPDFYLPAYNIYIEFWGMLNNSNPQYWQSFRWKTNKYQEHKVKFIPLRNEDLPELETIFPTKLQQAMNTKY